MKYFNYIFLLILFGCDSANEPIIGKQPSINIVGYVYELFQNENTPSINTEISISYNDSLIEIKTDGEGKFSINSNKYSEILQIKINKEKFTVIDTTINIGQLNSENQINLQLEFKIYPIILPKIVAIVGYIYEQSLAGKDLSIGTDVYCDYNDSSYTLKTDVQGKFTFVSNRHSDYLKIKLLKNNFSSIDTIIAISVTDEPDTLKLELEFTLNKLMSYFPFSIGKKWNYDVISWTYSSTQYGEEEWEIIEIAPDTSSMTFRIAYYYEKERVGEIFTETIIKNIRGEDTIKVDINENGNLSSKDVSTEIWQWPKLHNCLALINKSDGFACYNNFGEYFNLYHPFNGTDQLDIALRDNCGGELKYTLIKNEGFNYMYISLFTMMSYNGVQYILKE